MQKHVPRKIGRLIEEYLRYFPCVAVIGPRQCGKTTLVKTLARDWTLFDLEKSDDFHQISDDPDLFLRLHPDQTVIDEAQLMPNLFPALRVAVDADRSRKGRYIITGSNSPTLLRPVSESLAGRVGIVEMSPLSLEETIGGDAHFYRLFGRTSLKPSSLPELSPRCGLQDLHKYWFEGGYPEPWCQADARFRDVWLSQYIRTYLERDVSKLFPGLNAVRFRQFVEMLAGLSGRIVNYAETARALGISQPTARDYFTIAHHTFVWRHLPAYDKNVVKRVVKHPKGFLRDSGLLHYLARIQDLRHLLSHPCMGTSWEALVSEEILRGLQNRGIEHSSFHYRTAAGTEIDLVLEGRFGILPIEIKYRQSNPSKRLRALRDFVAERNLPLGLVIDNGEKVRQLDRNLFAVPFSCCV